MMSINLHADAALNAPAQAVVQSAARASEISWQRSAARFKTMIGFVRQVRSWHLGLLLACVCCADGAYLQAKAWLAQELIAQAWQQGLAQGEPMKPWPWADTWPVARLQAPAQGVDLYVLDGSHGSALAFGPGRLSGTADPGTHGLSIIGGHRDTHFRFLQRLQAGEVLQVTNPQAESVLYQVEASWIADIRQDDLTANQEEDRLLLVTCYPFDALLPGGPLRYVVSARRVTAPSV